MNFIAFNSINFKDELNKALMQESAKEDICLITHEKLNEVEKITLPCNHSFNYTALITSLHKNKNYSSVRSFNKNISYKCPYCRTEGSKLLPYIPELFPTKLYGINYTINDNIEKMKYNSCKYINTKNKTCNKTCLNEYCKKHCPSSLKQKSPTVKELKLKAKQLKLKNYSRLKKSELIELIEKNKNI